MIHELCLKEPVKFNLTCAHEFKWFHGIIGRIIKIEQNNMGMNLEYKIKFKVAGSKLWDYFRKF